MTDDDVDFEVGEPVLAGASGADSKSSESTPASLSVFDVMDDNEGEEDDELFRGPSLKAERKAAADALASYTSTEHKEAPTGAAEMTTSSVATATTQGQSDLSIIDHRDVQAFSLLSCLPPCWSSRHYRGQVDYSRCGSTGWCY
jgi:hypothetical protein